MAGHDDLAAIEKRIDSAWRALQGARAVHEHAPTGDNCAVEQLCERTLNELIEQWHGMQHADEIVKG